MSINFQIFWGRFHGFQIKIILSNKILNMQKKEYISLSVLTEKNVFLFYNFFETLQNSILILFIYCVYKTGPFIFSSRHFKLIFLSIHPSIYPSFLPSIHLSFYLSILPAILLSTLPAIYRSILLLSILPAIHLSILLSVRLAIHLSIYPSIIHPSCHLSIFPSFIHPSCHHLSGPLFIRPSCHPPIYSSMFSFFYSSILF